MPCNLAVAITRVAVTKDALLELLTPQIVEQVVLTYLSQQYAASAPFSERISGPTVSFTIGPCRVTIAQGRVRVRPIPPSEGNRALATTLANELSDLLNQLAGELFAQKVQDALQARTAQQVTTEVVEVDYQGQRRKATVFRLTL